jgi:hypothetical protein
MDKTKFTLEKFSFPVFFFLQPTVPTYNRYWSQHKYIIVKIKSCQKTYFEKFQKQIVDKLFF